MHNFIGITNKANNFRKGVFTDPYDEPVYLTFALDFQFEETVSNLMENHLWESPLFSGDKYGAIQFLSDRGYSAEANGLTVFRKILRYLTFDAPWYFQELGGLEKLWSGATQVESGYKAKEAKISVTTLEAVDLRITELADLYRNAVYDKIHMRERVPDNLRWFTMDIYIAEARNLRFRLPGVGQNVANLFGVNTGAIGNIVGGGNDTSNVLKDYGYIKFRCRQCEFDFSGSFAAGITQSVITPTTPNTNKFNINIGYFEEESKYPDGTKLYDSSTKTMVKNPWDFRNLGTDITNAGSFLAGMPFVGEAVQDAGSAIRNGFAAIGGLINPALGAASNFIDPRTKNLGNIYK